MSSSCEAQSADWNDIWTALQELGAAMRPVLDSGNVPAWAARLADAMDEAEEPVANRALEASHAE